MVWVFLVITAISLFTGLTFWIFAKPLAEKLNFQLEYQNRNSGKLITGLGVFCAIGTIITAYKWAEIEMDATTDIQGVATFFVLLISTALAIILPLAIVSFKNDVKKTRAIILFVVSAILIIAFIALAPSTIYANDNFTNKYGTPTTKCSFSFCEEYIAKSGDTSCCDKHSNRCLHCGCYIDSDAMYCMECIKNAIYN